MTSLRELLWGVLGTISECCEDNTWIRLLISWSTPKIIDPFALCFEMRFATAYTHLCTYTRTLFMYTHSTRSVTESTKHVHPHACAPPHTHILPAQTFPQPPPCQILILMIILVCLLTRPISQGQCRLLVIQGESWSCNACDGFVYCSYMSYHVSNSVILDWRRFIDVWMRRPLDESNEATQSNLGAVVVRPGSRPVPRLAACTYRPKKEWGDPIYIYIYMNKHMYVYIYIYI